MRSLTLEAAYAGGFFVFYDVSSREFPNFEIVRLLILKEQNSIVSVYRLRFH